MRPSGPESCERAVEGVDSVRLLVEDLERARIDLDAASRLLNGSERARAARYRREDDRVRFATGRAMLRRALGEALGTEAASLELRAGAGGRLRLDTTTRGPVPEFSVTHGGSYIVLALATRPVGVDVEPVHRARPDATLARRTCTPREILALAHLSDEEAALRFAELWTRKEALVKASSTVTDLSVLEVLDERVELVGDPRPWRLRTIGWGRAHALSVVLATETDFEVEIVTPHRLGSPAGLDDLREGLSRSTVDRIPDGPRERARPATGDHNR